jgi:hypothetical protein
VLDGFFLGYFYFSLSKDLFGNQFRDEDAAAQEAIFHT